MNSHKNARLTPLGRAHMLKQAALIGLPLAAAQAGISLRRAQIWQRRFQREGEAGLADRSSRPQRSPRQTGVDKRERIIALRRNHRLPYAEIACRVGGSLSTIGRICQSAQVDKLPPLEDAPPKCRYERASPGELLHLDTKKLARFDRPGHRVTGDVSKHSRKPGPPLMFDDTIKL